MEERWRCATGAFSTTFAIHVEGWWLSGKALVATARCPGFICQQLPAFHFLLFCLIT